MTINEFNQQVLKAEDGNNVYLDLRPFGERQSEAMDAYLSAAVTQSQAGASSFGPRQIVLITDAWVILSNAAHAYIAELRSSGALLTVEARRP